MNQSAPTNSNDLYNDAVNSLNNRRGTTALHQLSNIRLRENFQYREPMFQTAEERTLLNVDSELRLGALQDLKKRAHTSELLSRSRPDFNSFNTRNLDLEESTVQFDTMKKIDVIPNQFEITNTSHPYTMSDRKSSTISNTPKKIKLPNINVDEVKNISHNAYANAVKKPVNNQPLLQLRHNEQKKTDVNNVAINRDNRHEPMRIPPAVSGINVLQTPEFKQALAKRRTQITSPTTSRRNSIM